MAEEFDYPGESPTADEDSEVLEGVKSRLDASKDLSTLDWDELEHYLDGIQRTTRASELLDVLRHISPTHHQVEVLKKTQDDIVALDSSAHALVLIREWIDHIEHPDDTQDNEVSFTEAAEMETESDVPQEQDVNEDETTEDDIEIMTLVNVTIGNTISTNPSVS